MTLNTTRNKLSHLNIKRFNMNTILNVLAPDIASGPASTLVWDLRWVDDWIEWRGVLRPQHRSTPLGTQLPFWAAALGIVNLACDAQDMGLGEAPGKRPASRQSSPFTSAKEEASHWQFLSNDPCHCMLASFSPWQLLHSGWTLRPPLKPFSACLVVSYLLVK